MDDRHALPSDPSASPTPPTDPARTDAAMQSMRRALARNRELLARTFNATAEALVICDAVTGTLLQVNDRWVETFGVPREEAVGTSTIGLGLYEDPADRERHRTIFLRDGRVRDQETRLRSRRDGTVLTMLVSIEPLGVDEDDRSLMLVSLRDVTDRARLLAAERTARAALESALDALREADGRRTEFLAILSHELRNPLAALRTGLALLGRDAGLSAPSRTAVDIGGRQLARLSRLVDELLDASRIARGLVELVREPLPLQRVIGEAVDTLRPSIDERAQRVELDLPATPVVVDGDALRLGQVVENLLANASKYSESGGRIRVSLATGAGEAIVEVGDDGIGIDPQDQPRLFEPFTQVEASVARSHGGMGIGLSLVRRLVELHGGRVEARSEGRGRGSVFTVRLPVVPGP